MNQNCSQCDLDVGIAGEVQQLLFPKGSPVCSWCCIGVKNRMANGLGGDYFDFITMPDDCQVVFIGDVTGHGLSASVVMSLLYGYIYHAARKACEPLELISLINDFLVSFAARSQEFDHFFSTTLFWSIIDPNTLEMHYVNAGHVAPMIRRGEEVIFLDSTAAPLGFFPDPEVEMSSFQFEKEDRFLLYTDGLTETSNQEGHLFGIERLKRVVLGHEGDHLEFLDEIFDALKDFGGAVPQTDDSTAIVLDFHGFSPAPAP